MLLFSVLGLTFSPRPQWNLTPPPRAWVKYQLPTDRPFIASIESPTTIQSSSHVAIAGWAAPTSENVLISSVQVWIDGTMMAETSDFIPRRDVAVAFDRPNLPAVAWRCVIGARKLALGSHELQVRAAGSDGSSAVIQTTKVTIIQ